jgi:hypothetical protein
MEKVNAIKKNTTNHQEKVDESISGAILAFLFD